MWGGAWGCRGWTSPTPALAGPEEVTQDVQDGGHMPAGSALTVLQFRTQGAREAAGIDALAKVTQLVYDCAARCCSGQRL